MRDANTLHDQVYDTEEALSQDEALHWSVTRVFSKDDTGAMDWALTEAITMRGVSCQPILDLHHQLRSPPIVRASVKDGTLYMPRVPRLVCP